MKVLHWKISVFTLLLTAKLFYSIPVDLFPFFNDFIENEAKEAQAIVLACNTTENLIKFLKDASFTVGINRCITNLKFLDSDLKQNLILIADLTCPVTRNYIENILHPQYFTFPLRWIFIDHDLKNIPNIKVLPDSNVHLVTVEKLNGFHQIQQFYKIDKNSSYIFEQFGKWSAKDGLIDLQKERILSKRRRNLRNKALRATVVYSNIDTRQHLDDDINRHIDPTTKTTYRIAQHLVKTVNASMAVTYGNDWGYPDPKTGKYTGMLGDLTEDRADIGGTIIFMVPYRVPLVEYLSMTTPTKLELLFREPPLSYVSNIYSLPLSRQVWVTAGAMVISAVLIILMTVKLEARMYSKDYEKQENLRFTDFILIGISSVCQMGTSTQPKLASARIATIFLLIAILFLYTSYTANIVALLQSTTKSIQTLSDLFNSQLSVGVDDTLYNRHYFGNATEPLRKAFYEKKVISKGVPQYLNVSDGMSKLRKGFYAFQIELSVAYQIMEETFYEHEKCNLRTVTFLQVSDPWFVIAKRSPYKEILKSNLFRIREHGVQGRENSRIYTKKPVCITNGQSFGSVGLIDCYAAFGTLAFGCGLSFILLILEILLKNYKICLY